MAELADWRPEVLVVVGGTLWETERAPDISALLNEQFQRGATLAGICGGTLALARAGLLNGRAHTSNDAGFLTRHAEGYTGQRHFVASAAAVVDDRVITAPDRRRSALPPPCSALRAWMKRRCASSAPCWRRSTRWGNRSRLGERPEVGYCCAFSQAISSAQISGFTVSRISGILLKRGSRMM